MNQRETAELLTYASMIDNRTVAPETVVAWHEVIGHLDQVTAREAIVTHRRESTDYLMPAHIIRNARRIRESRRALEATPECPFHPGYPVTRIQPTCAACEREKE